MVILSTACRSLAGMDDQQLGERLRVAREAAGMSMRALGSYLELDASAVNRIEKGRRGLRATELVAAARALNVSMDELAGGTAQKDAADRVALSLAEVAGEVLAAWLGAGARVLEALTIEYEESGRPLTEYPADWVVALLSRYLPPEQEVSVPPGSEEVFAALIGEQLPGRIRFTGSPPASPE